MVGGLRCRGRVVADGQRPRIFARQREADGLTAFQGVENLPPRVTVAGTELALRRAHGGDGGVGRFHASELNVRGQLRHHLNAADPQEVGQGPARHVVRRIALRVALDVEQVLHVRAVGLIAPDDEGAGGVGAAIGGDLALRDANFHPGLEQDVHEAPDSARVTVVGGDEPGAGTSLRAGGDGALGGLQGVAQP